MNEKNPYHNDETMFLGITSWETVGGSAVTPATVGSLAPRLGRPARQLGAKPMESETLGGLDKNTVAPVDPPRD